MGIWNISCAVIVAMLAIGCSCQRGIGITGQNDAGGDRPDGSNTRDIYSDFFEDTPPDGPFEPDEDLVDPISDSLVDGEVDALVDPIPEDELDPAPEMTPDTELDPGLDSDPPTDLPWDPYADVPPDGMVGRCNIVGQTGCPSGAWCSWALDPTYCHWYEECSFRAPGTLPHGDPCGEIGGDFCEPGTDCRPDSSHVWSCREWCHDDLDCSVPGEHCYPSPTERIGIGPCYGTSLAFPYGSCWP